MDTQNNFKIICSHNTVFTLAIPACDTYSYNSKEAPSLLPHSLFPQLGDALSDASDDSNTGSSQQMMTTSKIDQSRFLTEMANKYQVIQEKFILRTVVIHTN